MDIKKITPPGVGRTGTKGASETSINSNIIIYPRRLRHPPTLAEIIVQSRVTHTPRGLYHTPMPDDWRGYD